MHDRPEPFEVILIPGFWLDASSWDDVVPAIEAAGHRAHPLTLPGLESRDADRSGIRLADHIDAVVRRIDAAEGRVVLVGHSGGSTIAHGAVDARPDRVARVIHVDDVPPPNGTPINSKIPAVDGEIPLPEWSFFVDEHLVGLDDELREQFRARAVPQPAAVASDPIELGDERRFAVPVTIIACEFEADEVRQGIAEQQRWAAEIGRLADVRYVELPTGHWPQFTRPADLAEVIVAELALTSAPPGR
ncbi:alpha/beta fold hydrolase [Agromyces bauzanensis]